MAAFPSYGSLLTDPDGSNALVAAVQWLQGTMLGTVATTVAVVAVAAVGFLMLSGRMDWRRGATVIVGCFVLFGATSIVAGIRNGSLDGAVGEPDNTTPSVSTPARSPSTTPTPNDPYAGA